MQRNQPPSQAASGPWASEPENTALRPPPHNYEAERALIGAIFFNNRAYDRAVDHVTAEEFADPVNGIVFEACGKLIARGQQANPVTLRPYLESNDAVKAAGGMKYLAGLMSGQVTVINARDYAKLIHELYLRRLLIDVGTEVVNRAYDGDLDTSAKAMVDEAEERLHAVGSARAAESRMVRFAVAAEEAMEQIHAAKHNDTPIGVKTGIKTLDTLTSGLRGTDFVILAGRPSMGKTALGIGIADFAATESQLTPTGLTAIFSLEMSREQLAARQACSRKGISSQAARSGKIDMLEYADLMSARDDMAPLPLYVDDSPGLTTATIRARLRRLERQAEKDKQPGVKLVVIDYLQLLKPTREQRHQNRSSEIGYISHDLKDIAKEFNTTVIALSQLSRAVEQRQDKRPQLADLRESGDLEQDADLVMFVFRQAYYHQRNKPARANFHSDGEFLAAESTWHVTMEAIRNQAEIILAKNRHGPIGTAQAHFEETYTRFSNP